jgi:uncharacterized coiled-coil DUF342 family protein
MPQLQILSGPASTRRLLTNLSLAIDEARIVRNIVDLSDNLRRIEYSPDSTSRVAYLRREIDGLESKLSELRELAKAN